MLLLTFGTRPEYIKIKPLIDYFTKRNYQFKTLFTGQHVDLVENVKFDYHIEIIDNTNRLNSIIVSILKYNFDKIRVDGITHVLVQGDTTSALAVAINSFNSGIKVIHLEAGLRTYDNENPYPEEINRKIISQLTNIHLCPTEVSKGNLVNEKSSGKIFVVGNTIIDALLPYKNLCEYGNNILVTMHRRENHNILDKWFVEIENLAKKYSEYNFIIPLHPNPNVQKYKDIFKMVNVIKPLEYSDLLQLLVKTRLVITDSGGLQEECSFFNKICLTCRKITERPESINQTTIMVESPDKLVEIFENYIYNYDINFICPFGEGNSAEIIYNILTSENI